MEMSGVWWHGDFNAEGTEFTEKRGLIHGAVYGDADSGD
jgi:hypothetical protein